MIKIQSNNKFLQILQIVLAIFLFLSAIPLTANAYSQITPSAEDFQEVYCRVSISVSFNATTLTGIPVLKTAEKSILITNKAGAAGTESDTLYAYTKAYYSTTEQAFFESVFGRKTIVYPKTSFEGSQFTNNGMNFSEINFYNTSYRILTDNSTRGIGLLGIIPDAKSIAADYCRKNNLLLGSIINISRKIDYKSTNVKSVFLAPTEPIETDSNLDDGYNIETTAHQGWEVAVGIAVVAFVIGFLIAANMNTDVELKQRLDENLNITVPTGNNTVSNFLNNHTNIVNINFPDNSSLSTAYDIYTELEGENATAEGFTQFIRSLYPNLTSPVISYTTIINQSQSPSVRANQTQAASQVAVFAESTQQIITLIIIIIVSVIAVALVIKMFKRSPRAGGVTIIDT
ncbi:MAG: hypothetical protein ACTSRP_09050 [Candidatus Helarchaeota archaeon]